MAAAKGALENTRYILNMFNWSSPSYAKGETIERDLEGRYGSRLLTMKMSIMQLQTVREGFVFAMRSITLPEGVTFASHFGLSGFFEAPANVDEIVVQLNEVIKSCNMMVAQFECACLAWMRVGGRGDWV